MCSLDTILLAFALLHFVLQGESCLLLWVSLAFLLQHSQSPMMSKTSFLGVILGGLLGLHRTDQLQFLWCPREGHDLDFCDVEWLALEANRDHSVIFEVAPKYCI